MNDRGSSGRLSYAIGYGANLGARAANYSLARSLLALEVTIEASAPLYESAPIGAADKPFLNGAWLVTTDLQPDALLKKLLRIEVLLGRERREKWGNRTCDLDILWLSRGRYESSDLTIPHPELIHRNFALAPLLDVLPGLEHEWLDGQSYRERLRGQPGELTPFASSNSEDSQLDEIATTVSSGCSWDPMANLSELETVDFDLTDVRNAAEVFEAGRDLALGTGRQVLAASVLATPQAAMLGRLLVGRMPRPHTAPIPQ